ncbi:MAG TPA: hypothetical protein VGZ02_03430 [Candidatus Baltobacteraceae bacterium]|jgi:hypothetical protein|nr:hypothetical protein [Candidatus Baltobacteraceae bacterium]
MPNKRRAALAFQAVYYSVTGAWPLFSRRTFEAVTGPKSDWWLVQMVGLLAFTNGAAIGSSLRNPPPEIVRLSLLSAFSFAAIDIVYTASGRISPVYLADAAVELVIAAFVA